MPRPLILAATVLALVSPARFVAQEPSKPASESEARVDTSAAASLNPFGYALAVGSVDYGSGRSSQSTTLIFQFKPVSWLTLATSPSFAKSQVKGTLTYSETGFTDTPLSAAASYDVDLPASPTLQAALGFTVPTGDSAVGFGSGALGYSAELGFGLSPAEGWNLSAGAGKSFSGGTYAGAYAVGSATALSGATSYEFSDWLTGSLGVSGDVGGDPAYRSGALATGVVIPISKPLAFSIDLSRGFGTAAPNYSLSLGIGTAVGGISPASLAAPFRRLRSAGVGGGGGKLAAYCVRLRRC
ncbi:MAG: hypothetical protein NVS1B4_24110 [Gemmatimonadaceae bacterium]